MFFSSFFANFYHTILFSTQKPKHEWGVNSELFSQSTLFAVSSLWIIIIMCTKFFGGFVLEDWETNNIGANFWELMS